MTAAAFHENWFCAESQEALANLASHIANVPGLIIEIGAWEGRSTTALANAVHPRVVHTCDTWNGDGHEMTTGLAAQRDVYAQWQANVTEWTKGNVVGYRMDWREFVPMITDQIAFAFIDAGHSYDEVYDNIIALIPLMAPGAIMCGDDAHHGPVQDAVFDVFGSDAPLWTATMWVVQIPDNAAELDDLRLRAIDRRLAPTDNEWTLAMDQVARMWRSYVGQVSSLDHAAGLATCAYLYRLCDVVQPRRILDLGSGLSSVVFRKWASTVSYPVEVVSVDTDAEWLEKTRDFMVDHEELVPTGLCLYPAGMSGRFDLIFHDLANGDTRNRVAAEASALLAPDGVILFDDAQQATHLATFERVAQEQGLTLYSLAKRTSDAVGRWGVLGFKTGIPVPPKPHSDLQAKYDEVSQIPSDIYLHLPRFVELALHCNVQKVIELGTRTGVSTIAWLYALEQTGGHLWSVDIDRKPPIGDYDHWTYIQGNDEDDAVLSQLPEQVDIVFLDTSHWYENTCRELELYRPLVKSGGMIICHDTELPHPEGSNPADPVYPVKTAIKEFVIRHGYRWANVPECWGLGIIEVV